jgi:signal transduction histidine kinase
MEQYQLLAERHRLVNELKDANESLQKANDDLQAANNQLRELDRIKSVFIDIASHELRTPVFVISGFARLLERQGTCPQKELRSIIDSAERLSSIVLNMAKLMESDEWERKLDTKPERMSELIDCAMSQVQPFIGMRNQQMDVDLADDLPEVEVQAPLIVDAIVNLLTNAIKFTPDEGLIKLQARSGSNGTVDLSVTDTGIGIPEDELPHIFKRFFGTFDTSHHSSGEYEFGRRGIGLGLNVVKRFVEMHGGSVDVKTTQGKGSTFTISLPARK